jgi:hypothetical protein
VLPPQQSLNGDDLAGGEVDLRLVVRDHLRAAWLVEDPAQVLEQRPSLRRRRFGARLEDG